VSGEADPLLAERPRLFALAYRMLGTVGEAEDVVQDAFVRWYAQARTGVANPPAFLTTIVTHLCLDVL
jgi:RNA polymerase sigma-70 factor (ECF subfamily)